MIVFINVCLVALRQCSRLQVAWRRPPSTWEYRRSTNFCVEKILRRTDDIARITRDHCFSFQKKERALEDSLSHSLKTLQCIQATLKSSWTRRCLEAGKIWDTVRGCGWDAKECGQDENFPGFLSDWWQSDELKWIKIDMVWVGT